jgi:hypothetical protein
MKRKYLYTATLIIAIVIVFKTVIYAYTNGAPQGLCGAPDDFGANACGTAGCHDFVPIANSPSLVITLIDPVTVQPVTTYQANTKYTVRVELTRASIKTCGFESTVETKSGNAHIGTLAGKLKSQVVPFSSNHYVTQINSSKTSTGYGKWEYYWTSPASGLADVVIYAAANDANGDGNSTGDSIFTANKTISHNSGIDNKSLNEADVKVFPNPVQDNFTVGYDLVRAEVVKIDLYDINGRQVYNISNGMAHTGNNISAANIAGLCKGIYFLKITTGDQTAVQKILKY